MNVPATIIIAHEPLLALGLRAHLLKELRAPTCLVATSAHEATSMTESDSNSLIFILRTRMTEDCPRVVQELRRGKSCPAIIVMTCAPSPSLVWRVMDAGARAVITTDDGLDEIHQAVEAVLRGGIHVSPQAVGSFRVALHGESSDSEDGKLRTLSPREMEVFESIGRGTCSKEIASRLSISVKTLDTHKARIKTKLNFQHATELARAAAAYVLRHEAGESRSDHLRVQAHGTRTF